MTVDEELEELRAWKKAHEHSALEDAFFQLERELKRPYPRSFDATMPVTAFRVLANALILLKQELVK